jgi:phage tail sheath protein FI
MAFQLSPGVLTREIDLSTTVGTGVATSIGAIAGNFEWGPVNDRTLIGSETELVDIFGKPNTDTYKDFFTATNFLAYSTALWVVRIGDANNEVNLNATSGNTAIRVDNDQDYDVTPLVEANGAWIARFPGAKGNSLAVAACDSTVTFTSNIEVTGNAAGTWDDYFDSVPGTSAHAEAKGGSLDEMHILIIDEDGVFSGTQGTILEKFAFVSKAPGAKTEDGTNNYYIDVINQRSKYVRAGGDYALNSNTTGTIASTWTAGDNEVTSLSGGTDLDTTSNNDEYIAGLDLFSNGDEVDVALLMVGAANATVAQYAIDLAGNRKDCVTFISPEYTDIQPGQPAATIAENIVEFKNSLNRSSSYYFTDSSWKYQYDKYNDVYRWVPLNGDIAGLCARTDTSRDPWWSPAGFNRGNIQNIVKLAWNPNQAQRDYIYKNGVNPVVSFPGEGTILYGDKTGLAKPSAFDRINVRRLFIVLEKSIATAAKYSMFEFNDEFTRAQFVSMVEPFLREVKGRRGIYDFQVVCDETNNTAQVIDSNEFRGDIYIKPARSINYIQLSFVAVRTGVEFSEVIGSF